MKLSEPVLKKTDMAILANCTICPRNCHSDRYSGLHGYCNAGAGFEVSSICVHKGEEPPVSGLSGICNVFFNRCNLQCNYCQNCQISTNSGPVNSRYNNLNDIVAKINQCLDGGCKALGFVSPSHMVPQMIAIIDAIHKSGRRPVIVYNTNSYEKIEVLRNLEGIIDVYIPDFKYSDHELAGGLSDARDYPEVAKKAVLEMFRQKGASFTDEDGQAVSGLIIRHLVIPGQVNNSLNVLRFIATGLSVKVHVSLMSQYHPMPAVRDHSFLGRTVNAEEYGEVF
ncbi:MAG: 4Fe-4S cluster-binding domain-containing protein [Bacteroidales bacterium]|nr:4Fe-4S cluster-binding domain-containing protein [Bacteroidales bacterium]